MKRHQREPSKEAPEPPLKRLKPSSSSSGESSSDEDSADHRVDRMWSGLKAGALGVKAGESVIDVPPPGPMAGGTYPAEDGWRRDKDGHLLKAEPGRQPFMREFWDLDALAQRALKEMPEYQWLALLAVKLNKPLTKLIDYESMRNYQRSEKAFAEDRKAARESALRGAEKSRTQLQEATTRYNALLLLDNTIKARILSPLSKWLVEEKLGLFARIVGREPGDETHGFLMPFYYRWQYDVVLRQHLLDERLSVVSPDIRDAIARILAIDEGLFIATEAPTVALQKKITDALRRALASMDDRAHFCVKWLTIAYVFFRDFTHRKKLGVPNRGGATVRVHDSEYNGYWMHNVLMHFLRQGLSALPGMPVRYLQGLVSGEAEIADAPVPSHLLTHSLRREEAPATTPDQQRERDRVELTLDALSLFTKDYDGAQRPWYSIQDPAISYAAAGDTYGFLGVAVDAVVDEVMEYFGDKDKAEPALADIKKPPFPFLAFLHRLDRTRSSDTVKKVLSERPEVIAARHLFPLLEDYEMACDALTAMASPILLRAVHALFPNPLDVGATDALIPMTLPRRLTALDLDRYKRNLSTVKDAAGKPRELDARAYFFTTDTQERLEDLAAGDDLDIYHFTYKALTDPMGAVYRSVQVPVIRVDQGLSIYQRKTWADTYSLASDIYDKSDVFTVSTDDAQKIAAKVVAERLLPLLVRTGPDAREAGLFGRTLADLMTRQMSQLDPGLTLWQPLVQRFVAPIDNKPATDADVALRIAEEFYLSAATATFGQFRSAARGEAKYLMAPLGAGSTLPLGMILTPLVGFIWFLQELQTIYGDPARLVRLATLQKAVTTLEAEITRQTEEAAVAATAPASSIQQQLIETTQNLYLATSAYQSQPHISRHMHLTDLAISLPMQGLAEIRTQLGVADVELPELTNPVANIQLANAFATFLAALQQANEVGIPNTYKKDLEIRIAPIAMIAARRRMSDALSQFRRQRPLTVPGAFGTGPSGIFKLVV